MWMGENVTQVLSHDSCVCNSFLCGGFSSATGSICGMEGNCSGISQPLTNGRPLWKRSELPSSVKVRATPPCVWDMGGWEENRGARRACALLAAWWSARRQQSGGQSMRRIDLFALEAGQKRMREKRWESVEWRMLSSAPTCVVSNTPPH